MRPPWHTNKARLFLRICEYMWSPLGPPMHPRSTTSTSKYSNLKMGLIFMTRGIFPISFCNITRAYTTSGGIFMISSDFLSTKIRAYIEETALPAPSPEERTSLADFSEDEIRQTKDFPLGKSPGPDGFNNKFYQTFVDILSLFNSISPTSAFAPQSLEAYISILPKPGKEPPAALIFAQSH